MNISMEQWKLCMPTAFNQRQRCSICGNVIHPMTISTWNPHTWLAIDDLLIVDPSTGDIMTSYELKSDFDFRPCQLFPALRRALYYAWKEKDSTKRYPLEILEKAIDMKLRRDLRDWYLNDDSADYACDSNINDDFDDMAHVQTNADLPYTIEWFDTQRMCHKIYGSGEDKTEWLEQNPIKLTWEDGQFLEILYLDDMEKFYETYHFPGSEEPMIRRGPIFVQGRIPRDRQSSQPPSSESNPTFVQGIMPRRRDSHSSE